MISVLLIGLGNIGIRYDIKGGGFIRGQTWSHAKAILESNDFELTSFTDESLEKLTTAHRVMDLANVKDNEIHLSDTSFDLVVVAVSTTQHANVVNSLTYPPKLLVLEKPGGSNSIECTRISSWAFENDVHVFVNYFRRYLSCSVRSRLYIGKLITGRFLSAEINAYGTLLNIHSHFIDLAFFLTSQRIFCDCTAKLKSQTGGTLVISCEACDATFRLGGIGSLKQDISLKLEFEYFEVFATQDGKRIEIVDKVNQVSTVFECELNEYDNYQKVVYEKIGAMLRSGVIEECYLGLEQANWVHLFLESVDLKDEE